MLFDRQVEIAKMNYTYLTREERYQIYALKNAGHTQIEIANALERSLSTISRVEPQVESAVMQYAIDEPAHGQVRVSNELRKRGIFASPSGVRSIWLRNDLANFKQRLKALEAKVAEDGIIMTEGQVQALERKKLDDEACERECKSHQQGVVDGMKSVHSQRTHGLRRAIGW